MKEALYTKKNLPIDLLEINEGQLSVIDEETNLQVGLGRNPRWIRDAPEPMTTPVLPTVVAEPEISLSHTKRYLQRQCLCPARGQGPVLYRYISTILQTKMTVLR